MAFDTISLPLLTHKPLLGSIALVDPLFLAVCIFLFVYSVSNLALLSLILTYFLRYSIFRNKVQTLNCMLT